MVVLEGSHLFRIIKKLTVSTLMWLILSSIPPSAKSQDLPEWDMDSIRSCVKTLLEQYLDIHNQLSGSSKTNLEREFIRLFSNPKILVVNDIEKPLSSDPISVQDYLTLLPARFPDGLTMSLNVNRMILSRPKYDFNNRYLVRARVEKGLMGFKDGKVFALDHKVVFSIGFNLINGQMSDFEIWGIAYPARGEDFAGISAGPAIGSLFNKQLDQDQRYDLNPGLTYHGGVQYWHFFTNHWGIRTGLNYSDYPANVTLDKFDPFGGFDPAMENVVLGNHLWYIELPLGISFKSALTKRISFTVSTGLLSGYRLFESFSSSAVNTQSGKAMSGVISDTDWISGLRRINLSVFADAAFAWFVKPDMALTAGVEYTRGTRSLGYVNRADYQATRYLGHYNPIWSVPGSKTLSQSVCFSLGTMFRLKWHSE